MAIAFDAASNSGYLSSTGTYTGSHTCTGSNRYLVLSLAVFEPEVVTPNASTHNPTYAGVSMTLLRRRTADAGLVRCELWGLPAPASGSNSYSLELPESNGDFVACFSSFTGVHQTISTESPNDASGSAGDPTVEVSIGADQSWVIDVVATDDTSITAGGGQTERGKANGARGTGAQSTKGPEAEETTTTMTWSDDSDRWAMCAIALRPPATAITGDAAITLGALTTTATATLALTATQSTTLGDATVSATGYPSPPVGSASITLDALTTAATATLALSATQSTQLGDATCTATGSVPAVEGSASITLDALTTTATGTLPLVATQATTLGNATSTATATLALNATQATTLGNATVSATGILAGTGTADITLGALTTTATSTLALAATQTTTLGDATCTATGTQTSGGTASITLDALTIAATAETTLSGAADITLGELTTTATAETTLSAAADITLGALTTTATATLDITASASITLGALTIAGESVGTLEKTGTASITLGEMTLQATDQLEPRHCCPIWPCEFVQVTVGESATYNCGSGAVAFPAIGARVLKLVQFTTDYHRWEYRSGSETGGVIYEITLECDRTQERFDEGYGPCVEITFLYDNQSLGTIGDPGILRVCFGPIIMDDRDCDCLTRDAGSLPNEVGLAYSESSDGYIGSSGFTYATARAGGLLSTDDTDVAAYIGQDRGFTRGVYESFFNFDLFAAGLSASDTVDSLTLELWIVTDSSGGGWTIEARANDWGDTLADADWVAGASLSGLTLLASLSTASITTGEYNTITASGSALTTAANAALAGDGILRMVLCSSNTTDDVDPSSSEYITVSTGDETGQKPRLTIQYTAAVTAIASDFPAPGANIVGFSWGTAFITGAAINADPQNDCECDFRMDAGDGILAVCLCSDICDCFGIDKRMHFAWECDGFDTIEVDLDWYPADEFPAGATAPPDVSAGGAWWGTASTGIEGCTIEVQLQCLLSSFSEAPFIWLHDEDGDWGEGACGDYELACIGGAFNPYLISLQCRDDTHDFSLVYGLCSELITAGACLGTTLSTMTFTERV